jgi:hypothetical protein
LCLATVLALQRSYKSSRRTHRHPRLRRSTRTSQKSCSTARRMARNTSSAGSKNTSAGFMPPVTTIGRCVVPLEIPMVWTESCELDSERRSRLKVLYQSVIQVNYLPNSSTNRWSPRSSRARMTPSTPSVFPAVQHTLSVSIVAHCPAYPGLLSPAVSLGLKSVGVPMDDKGIVADELDRIMDDWDENARGGPRPTS